MKRLLSLFMAGFFMTAGCGLSLRTIKPISYEKRLLVAVGDLQNQTGIPEYDAFMDSLTGSLISELDETECFRLIERHRLKSILEEMKLGMTGLTDPTKTREVGKLLGVDAILFVNLASVKYSSDTMSAFISKLETETFEVMLDARLVAVETGEILAAAKSSTCTKNRIVSAYFGLMKSGDKADQKQMIQKILEASGKELAKELARKISQRAQ